MRYPGFCLIVLLFLGCEAESLKVPEKEAIAGTLLLFPELVDMHDGTSMTGERGVFSVPQHHDQSSDKFLTIGFLRFKTQNPTPAKPLFLLAGGPGASWTADLSRSGGYDYKEVAFYKEFADVIIVDQRGSRGAFPSPKCYATTDISLDIPFTYGDWVAELQPAISECKQTWEGLGIDLDAFNTIENADDIMALREALGYEKINLVGGSYGSHLALTLMKRYPEKIERAMLRGLEGLDHTFSIPSEKLEALKRFAFALESSPAWQGHVPEGGFIAALKRINDSLAVNPRDVELTQEEGTVSVRLNNYDIQNIALSGANNRANPDAWARIIVEMVNGDFTYAARQSYNRRRGRVTIRPMIWMTDCASGISADRRNRIEADPNQDVLAINEWYTGLCSTWNAPDLGDEFRKPVISDIPVLFFHGLWDISTPIENAREVIKGFKNGKIVEVENGTHSVTRQLYEHWEPMRKTVRDFMYGEEVDVPEKISLPLPIFKGLD